MLSNVAQKPFLVPVLTLCVKRKQVVHVPAREEVLATVCVHCLQPFVFRIQAHVPIVIPGLCAGPPWGSLSPGAKAGRQNHIELYAKSRLQVSFIFYQEAWEPNREPETEPFWNRIRRNRP